MSYNCANFKANKQDSNNFNIGSSFSKYPDIDGETLSQKSTCDKYKWAKQYAVSWEGLSYGVSMDCS